MNAREKVNLLPEEKLMRAIFGWSPDNTRYRKEVDGVTLRAIVDSVLSTLGTREARIVRIRFGFATSDSEEGVSHTLEEVGKVFNVTRGRIQQIEQKALRRLRHHTRSRLLRRYIQIGENNEHIS